MKIGYYIVNINIKLGGVFPYSIGVLKLLLKSKEISTIFLFYSISQQQYLNNFITNKKIVPILIKKPNIVWNVFTKISNVFFKLYFIRVHKYQLLKRMAIFFNPFRKILHKYDFDVFHVPIQISPVYGIKIPVIITMHDMQELHFPEYFTSQDRMLRTIEYKKAIDESDHIIVSFYHVKQDILKYFEINDNKISVCSLPLADDWFNSKKVSLKKELSEKYNINSDFILYPAATWQHKNHNNLLNALKILKDHGNEVNLVCTGLKTNYFTIIENEIISLGMQDNVKLLGIVPEKDLIGLYYSTKLVVIPTLYEAGSGPLFEAMRYNIPVICSNVTSLPESINDNEFVFDPNSPKEIANLIYKGCFDKKFIKRNIENSKRRIEFYKIQNFITPFITAYKKAIVSKNV